MKTPVNKQSWPAVKLAMDHVPENMAQALYCHQGRGIQCYVYGKIVDHPTGEICLGLGEFEDGAMKYIDASYAEVYEDGQKHQWGTLPSLQEEKTHKARSLNLVVDQEFEEKEHQRYNASVEQALKEIEQGLYQKIVLARQKILRPIDSQTMINHPQDWIQHLYNPHHIGHQLLFQTHDQIFLSLSPESLYCMKGEELLIDAIAGTTARGKTPEEDHALFETLKNDPKEQREHDLVCEDVVEALTSLGYQGSWDFHKKALKLKYVQHLYSLYRVKCKQDCDWQKIIQALHPTSAVGGRPRTSIMAHLKRLEGRLRGVYAAPFVVKTPKSTIAGVGIRSAVITSKQVIVWAGAGIVKGSDPEREWQETQRKCRNFI